MFISCLGMIVAIVILLWGRNGGTYTKMVIASWMVNTFWLGFGGYGFWSLIGGGKDVRLVWYLIFSIGCILSVAVAFYSFRYLLSIRGK